jgi:hypothetical protein
VQKDTGELCSMKHLNSRFQIFTSKHAMINEICEQIFKFSQENKPVKYIRRNHAGENQGLKNRLQSANWKIPIKFEFTVCNAPQKNLARV